LRATAQDKSSNGVPTGLWLGLGACATATQLCTIIDLYLNDIYIYIFRQLDRATQKAESQTSAEHASLAFSLILFWCTRARVFFVD